MEPPVPGYPGASWEKIPSPGDCGWSAEKLGVARAYAATIASDAVMVVVGGRIVDEWGGTARRFNTHSIRKALLGALIGIHVGERRIRLADTLAGLGIDDNEPLTTAEKQATVADLLEARSGVYHPALYDLARFGLLFLRHGRWRGAPIVARDWIEESTRSHSDLGQKGGYGYMWYVAPAGSPHLTSAWFDGPVISAQGFGGHYLVLVPHLDLVVVHRVDTETPDRQVTEAQFGRLMQLILDFAPG